MILEVIAKDILDIKKINESDANRIEFCDEMDKGGFTPKYDEIKEACEISKLPINVMCRRTESYILTDEDLEQLLLDASFISTTKANGIVYGAVTKDKKIDVEKLKKIIAAANGKKIIFHRAFDEVEDKIEGVKILAELGVSTILTCGGVNKILDNLETLKELSNLNKIEILAGSGIDLSNIDEISKNSNSIHIGTAVREEKNWDTPLSISKINKAKKIIG